MHVLWTGIITFLISIPILESGRINRDVVDESFFIALWILGVLLLFYKKTSKLGFILTLAPVLFMIPVIIY